MFVGRIHELRLLEDKYRSDKSELVVVYGRPRIGKSSLVEEFAGNKKFFYKFEGIEGEDTPGQIKAFVRMMTHYVDDPFVTKMNFDSWHTVFDYLTEKLIKKNPGKGRHILGDLRPFFEICLEAGLVF